ncbi:MAG TPA: hypothetical protein H9694_01930 [Firmicutes bacterium]|nr:hypothetical protein [Bacillota bacterium]
MTSLEAIRSKIKGLYKSNPNIHVSVSTSHPRICLKNEPAVLKGVYPHIFQIEERSSGVPKCHTIQYTEVITKQIELVELNDNE